MGRIKNPWHSRSPLRARTRLGPERQRTCRQKPVAACSSCRGPSRKRGVQRGRQDHRAAWLVHIEKVANGFEYASDPKKRYKIAAESFGFRELSPLRAKGMLEQSIEPG